jgi:hypothetical protein
MYAQAYSLYSAYLAALEAGITQGDTKHLDEDSDFQKMGNAGVA